MLIKILVILGLCALFFYICYSHTGDDVKNMIGFRSYPLQVQQLVRENETLGKLAPKEVNLVKVFISNLVLFTVLFFVVGFLLKITIGFQDELDCYWYLSILGQVLNAFDFIVIDLLWWRNTPRIRFSFLPEKELYQDPTQHIQSFWRGAVMYEIVAAVDAFLIMRLM